MKDAIREYLSDKFPQIDFSDSARTLEDEIDSLTMVEMIACLSEEYAIEFSYEEISPENFENLDSIVELVERIRGNEQ